MSSCNSYYWFSPSYWICNGAGALTSGLSSGALDGVEHQVEQSINKLTNSIGEAAEKAFIKLGNYASNIDSGELGSKAAKSIQDFASSFQANSHFSVDSGTIGKNLAQNLKEFGTEFEKSLGVNGAKVGGRFAHELDGAFNNFWDTVNLKGNTLRFTNEVNDAFTVGIENVNFAEKIKLAADEIGEGMQAFREAGVKEVELFRHDVQQIFANIARDTTLKMIPWIALGGAVLIGTPLLTMYVYKKAVHNIGRPQLAQEIRKVGVWNRSTDGIARTVSSIWSSTKTGIKWSALAGTAGLTLTIAGAIVSGIMTGERGYGGEILSGLSCAMGASYYNCNSSSALPLISATVGAGILRASTSIASSFYSFVKKAIKKDDQPVFNDELQKRIDGLTKATYNINRNGGYMQNLLLYGPGGTGKTMISKYIAKNSKMNYVMMSGGDLAQYIKRGEHVTELNKLFEDAKNSHSPTIVFIDECESLCGDRGKMDRSELIELVNSFLNHTGEPSKKVMVILTTNRKDDLDPAVLSRMDHKLYIGLPEQAERKKIIELYLPIFMTPLERNELFTDKVITNIAKQTEGFTGRTIFKMLNTMSAMRAATNNNRLTQQMVNDTVSAFVKQEVDIKGITHSLPVEAISKPVSSVDVPPFPVTNQSIESHLETASITEQAIEKTFSGSSPSMELENNDAMIKNTVEAQMTDARPGSQPQLKSLNELESAQVVLSPSSSKTPESFNHRTIFTKMIESIRVGWKTLASKAG